MIPTLTSAVQPPTDLPGALILAAGLAGLVAGYAIARHTGPRARHYCDMCAVFEVDRCGDVCDDCTDAIAITPPSTDTAALQRIRGRVLDEVQAQRVRREADRRHPGAVRMGRR